MAISAALTARKTKNENLSVTRFPFVKINGIAANPRPTHLASGLAKLEKFLCFGAGEEWSFQKFVHPYHLVASVR